MAPVVEGKLASAAPSIFAQFSRYKVAKSSEKLAAIARRFGVTTVDLASANNLRTTSKLKSGQPLLIPRVVTTALASRPAETQHDERRERESGDLPRESRRHAQRYREAL